MDFVALKPYGSEKCIGGAIQMQLHIEN